MNKAITFADIYPFKFALALPRIGLKASFGFVLTTAIITLFAATFLWLWQNFQVVNATYRLEDLQEKINGLNGQIQTLKSTANNGGLSGLEQIAGQLGLEKIETINFLRYPETTVVAR